MTDLYSPLERGECSTSRRWQAKTLQENPFGGIPPYPSYTSRAGNKRPCDVFINHRGCDTKQTLASTIHYTLYLNGIHAFLDREELELGDSIPCEIQGAMDSAALHIAIFSERYAESAWCLTELSYMLHTGTPILPVFYHVDPSDLRWLDQGKGCYAHAFSQHEEKGRYSSDKLQDWKMALERVSNLSGHVIKRNIGDEGELLKKIVESTEKVMKKKPLEVAKYPVGMDEIVHDFERSLKEYGVNEEGVHIVGIVSFGGSGKTTLATELFNRKYPSIYRSCFMHDVRDAASRYVLHTKQKKLLKDLRIHTEEFDSVKEGKAIIADRLRDLLVLIVLDDVNRVDQLDALLPKKESLGRGSLVIITTRDVDVLTKWGITSIYKAEPLRHSLAKQLFCLHAFSQPFPPQGFEDLVESFLMSCSGWPLSLTVIGGQLYERSRDYWVSQLEKIQRILPSEILERLKVSYDALDEEEQEIFLDIACFFIGERRRRAIDIWDASGWSGLCSLEALQNKCLVEIHDTYDGEKYIRMHDHLRDLGRRIAKTHSPRRILNEGAPFRGLAVSGDRRVMFEDRGGEAIESAEKYAELLRGLLWIEWWRFKYTSIPSWLPLDIIKFLAFHTPRCLKTLWHDASPPLQLRELRIEGGSTLQSLPRSIGRLQHLRRLSLGCSSRLSILPEEFCELQLLEHFVLQNCDGLSSLPNRFGDLVNLRHLDLRYCKRLKSLPESFKQLIYLKYLNLDGCESLESLDNIPSLKAVYVGNITDHTSVAQLSFRFSSMGEYSLRFRSSSIGRFLPIICQLSEWKELYPNEYQFGYFSEASLPIEISQMSSLRNLTIKRWPKLYEISNLAGMVSLTNLEVRECDKLKEINLAGLVSLTNLEVRECDKLKEIKFSHMSSLQNLIIKDCYSLMEIEGLEHLTSLENLVLWGLWKEGVLDSLSGLERLQTLNLRAENILGFGDCIQHIEMKNWPREMTICGLTFSSDFQWILDWFTFPGFGWSLKLHGTNLSNAALVCYLLHCQGFTSHVRISKAESTCIDLPWGGRWIVISVFKEDFCPVEDGDGDLHSLDVDGGEVEVLGRWAMVGERACILDGLKQLFILIMTSFLFELPVLKKKSSISLILSTAITNLLKSSCSPLIIFSSTCIVIYFKHQWVSIQYSI